MPATIYDTETNSSIEGVRVGNSAGMIYLDAGNFDSQMGEVIQNTVRTQAVSGDTTLEIDNSYDYEDTGVVHVYIAGVRYSIEYTGITRSETVGVLTGIAASGDGSITVTVPAGTVVWQGETEGQPYFYTVRNSLIEFWPLPDASNDNQNVYVDFNTAVTEVDSEADVIDYLRYDMISSYLQWRIYCKSELDGKLDKGSGFYQEYKEVLNDAIRTMRPNKVKTAPNINHMSRRGGRRAKPDPKLLPNDQQ